MHPHQPLPNKKDATATCDGLTVMFDGACPLCRREIAVYRSLKPLEPVQWLDVSDTVMQIAPEERARFMARFHARQKDGSLLSGAAAFVALWLAMPGWRWLGRLGSLPGMTPVLELIYRGFLRVRPSVQRWMRGV
jgi:3-demethoxyubiquinol 3-hydroxylase